MSTLRTILVAGAGALVLLGAGCGIGDAQARLRTAVDAQKPSLDDCYGAALERDSDLQGEMRVWLYVSHETGRVDRMEVQSSELDDDALRQCVEGAVMGTSIDPPPKANLKVDYSLVFSPEGGVAAGPAPAAGTSPALGAGGEAPPPDDTAGAPPPADPPGMQDPFGEPAAP